MVVHGNDCGTSDRVRGYPARDYSLLRREEPFSSGGRTVHRLSTRGSRRLNNTLHMAAVTQIRNPGTEGRIYFERKVAEGKTKKEALRSLKRQISNAVYRQLVLDAG